MKSNIKITLKQKAFFCLLLFAASFLAAQESSGPGSSAASVEPSAESSGAPSRESSGEPLAEAFTDLSVTDLLEAAKGRFLIWRPDWPLSVPPDLFYTVPESAATVITVSFETPPERFAEQAKGEGAEGSSATGSSTESSTAGAVGISVEWQNGRLVRFPVFRGSSFMQAAAEYNAEILTGVSGEDLEISFIEYDEEGRPFIARIRAGDGYFFAVLEYGPGGVTETWYDENGVPQSVLSAGETGDSVRIRYGENGAEAEARRFFFNSYGLVSEIRAPEGSWSAQYERRGFPRYLERNLGAGIERCRFQWDEAGRLTRLSVNLEDGRTADSRFEYVLDDKGNWILRREITMTNRSGRLFPGPGPVVRRQIQYGDRP